MKKLFAVLSLVTVFIAGCRKDDYVETPGLCPVVISTSPASGETDVPIVKIITATFNEAIDPSTITQSSFTLQGISPVTGTVSYTGRTASFNPTSLLDANTTYTAKITTAVKDLMGNALQTDFLWTFSTGATLLPVVISTSPPNNATNVPQNQIITATFSMGMDTSTINTTNFTLAQGAISLAGTVSYSGTTASFTPSVNLLTNTTYTATIKAAARKRADISLANDYVWTFSTGATVAPTVIFTDPFNNETNVLLNKSISATFSQTRRPPSTNVPSPLKMK